MIRKTISMIILILLIGVPLNVIGDDMKSIIIIVDELPMDTIEKLSMDSSSYGLINLKTRNDYTEENLYWSINLGKKVNQVDIDKVEDHLFIGEVLKDEKLAHMGIGREGIILSNGKRKLDYEKNCILYDFEWLVENTNDLLGKSNLLVIGYEFENQLKRIDILKKYLKYYNSNQIIVLPKSISNQNSNLLNEFLVPIIYVKNGNKGLLTSLSTKRLGFISLEDISTQLKNSYGYFNKLDIGNSFNTIQKDDPIVKINRIYKNTMNLLIIAYIFHGLTYIIQIILGLWLLRFNNINKKIFIIFILPTIFLLMSILLSLIGIHKSNIILYLLLITLFSLLILKMIANKGYYYGENLIIFTYVLIVFATLFYPEMIYNSYIGFNNLIYGARYYGLNNGIMGVLLSTSFLSYLILTERYKNINQCKLIGIIIFGLNMVVLSTEFGSNTGGFITSIILFILMINNIISSDNPSFHKITISIILFLLIFSLNIYLDNKSFSKSHAVEFIYRLKENGFNEFKYIAFFKAKELFSLTIKFPFSLVLIFQGIVIKKLSKIFMTNNKIKKEIIIITITSLIGFFINDTGSIMLIYMINYYILYMLILILKFTYE